MTHSPDVILLVEDEAIIAMSEKMVLEKHGYRVVVVHSGEAAVTAAAEMTELDLVLMDIDLGSGMDGTEAAEEILRRRNVPLVFLSSHTEPAVVEKTEGITSYGYIVKNSGKTVFLAAIKMAFRLYAAHHSIAEKKIQLAAANEELRVINDQLQSTNRRLEWWDGIVRYVVEHAPSAVIILDTDLRVVYMSERFCRENNLVENNVLGRSYYEVLPWMPEKWRKVHQQALAGEVLQAEEDTLMRPDGSVDYVRWKCRPWYQANATVGGIIIYSELVTARKKMEDALREATVHEITQQKKIENDLIRKSGQWFQSLADTTNAAIFIYTEDRFVYCNESALLLTGYSRREFLGLPHVWDIFHPDHRGVAQKNAEARQRGEVVPDNYELKVLCKDGTAKWVELKVGTIDWEDHRAVLGTAFDISDRHEALERVSRLLSEKELILKEAHHRVKNNMMVISSLLSLQAEAATDAQCAAQLRDGAGRAQSMMVLYDKLYRAGGTGELMLQEFLEPLVDEIIGTFPETGGIDRRLQIQNVELGVKVLSSLGIIVNELITNSMKHAFKGRKKGTIGIEAYTGGGSEAETLTVEYHDDGVGISEAIDFESEETFGLQLIRILAEQLGGTVAVSTRGGGTTFAFTFPM